MYPLISTVGGFAFTLLFFFQRLVSTKLLADYSSLYVAYKIGLDKDILLLFRYFGIIPLILFFAAGICLLFSKSQRCDAAFLMIWSVLCFCLFVRVQTHGQQHLLMYAPAFMWMIILVSGRLEANLHGSKQYTTALTAAGMSLIVSLSPFIPRIQPASLQELKKPTMLPSFSWSPPKRSDAITVVGLLRYLDSLGAKGLHVGLLASSFTLNQDMLLNSEASLSLPRVSDTPRSYLVYLPDVDQRDGWSDALFNSGRGSSADASWRREPGCGGTSREGSVIRRGNRKAFRRLDKSFSLDGGVTVYIFEKTRELTDAECENLRERFQAAH